MKPYKFVVSIDPGFSRQKGMGIDVTGKTAQDIHFDDIWTHSARSIYAPLSDDLSNVSALLDAGDGICGLIGEDAALLNPTLCQSDSTEAHYGSDAQKLFVRSIIAKMLSAHEVPSGMVSIHLSLSIALMHVQYAATVKQAFAEPFTLLSSDGHEWRVTVNTCEVRTQPFQLAVAALSKWDRTAGTLLPVNIAPLMTNKLLVVMDFGSLTFQGAGFIRNLNAPPVKWCESVGSWEQVRSELKTRLQAKASTQGVKLYDPNMQEILSCYETGVFQRGKHSIDMTDEITAMIAPKVEQRLRIAEQQLRGGGNVGDMYIAGGDAVRNLPRFREFYESNIAGSIHLMADELGAPDPMWRIAAGGLVGAIRQYLTNGGKKHDSR